MTPPPPSPPHTYTLSRKLHSLFFIPFPSFLPIQASLPLFALSALKTVFHFSFISFYVPHGNFTWGAKETAIVITLWGSELLNRKSYDRESILSFMATSDVFKFLKIARVVGECNLRIFKTSRVAINHEMNEQVHRSFLFNKFATKLLHGCVSKAISVLRSIISIAVYNQPHSQALSLPPL